VHRLGILFLVPGSDVTLRVSGEARITNDEVLLEPCAVEGNPPKLGIVVTVEQSFFHCARAFRRSGLWEPARWPDRSGLATYWCDPRGNAKLTGVTAKQVDAELEVRDRDLF
jgi:uncharacterized protein